MSHENLAVEYGVRSSVENSFVKLMTAAMRLSMINYRMRVTVLVGAQHIEAIDRAFAAVLLECHCHVMARERCAQVYRRRIVKRISVCRRIRRRDMKCRFVFPLHFV